MKKSVFLFLGMVILALSGCFKGNNKQTFKNEPAIFFYYNIVLPMIETRWGSLHAPELDNQSYNGEEILLVNFDIDYSKQSYRNVYTVSNLQVIQEINSSPATSRSGEYLTDDYNAPIDYMLAEMKSIQELLFCWFRQKAPAGQTFEYEMLYDPADTSRTPSVYIRSKKTNEPEGDDIEIVTCFGFDMMPLLRHLKAMNTGSETVTFYVKYCTDGEDDYRYHEGGTISWNISGLEI